MLQIYVNLKTTGDNLTLFPWTEKQMDAEAEKDNYTIVGSLSMGFVFYFIQEGTKLLKARLGCNVNVIKCNNE